MSDTNQSETPADRPIEIPADLSFEAGLAELEAIVQRLERGQLDLEASIAAYERGTALRRHCAKKLEQARLRVDKITFDKAGEARLEPLDER